MNARIGSPCAWLRRWLGHGCPTSPLGANPRTQPEIATSAAGNTGSSRFPDGEPSGRTELENLMLYLGVTPEMRRLASKHPAIAAAVTMRLWPSRFHLYVEFRREGDRHELIRDFVRDRERIATLLRRVGRTVADLTEIQPDDPSFWMRSSKQTTKPEPFSKEKS